MKSANGANIKGNNYIQSLMEQEQLSFNGSNHSSRGSHKQGGGKNKKKNQGKHTFEIKGPDN